MDTNEKNAVESEVTVATRDALMHTLELPLSEQAFESGNSDER